MEEEFYATVKLISGEEIVSKVCYLEDEDKVLLENPLQVELAKQRKGQLEVSGFSFKETGNASVMEVSAPSGANIAKSLSIYFFFSRHCLAGMEPSFNCTHVSLRNVSVCDKSDLMDSLSLSNFAKLLQASS